MRKVSVIVPVYNTEKFLKECLDSILNQTYSNIEVILVEDGSLDSSLSILKAYQKDSHVILLENRSNKGVGYSRNRGIEHATGDYILFVDSDDLLSPVAIEYLVSALEKSNTEMSMCQYQTFFHSRLLNSKNHNGSFEVMDIEKDSYLLEVCGGACWAKLWKRTLLQDIRFPEGIIYEDAPFTFPLMVKASKISFIREPLYYYRFNINGITKKNKREPNRTLLDIYPSAKMLDENYQLVRRNSALDSKMKEMGYSILFLGALNSGFWFQMKERKFLSKAFYELANRHYGYSSYQDSSYLCRRIAEVPHFSIRIRYLNTFVFSQKYQLVKEENKLLESIQNCLEDYLSGNRKKCKVKRK